jgi:hypothetical protein
MATELEIEDRILIKASRLLEVEGEKYTQRAKYLKRKRRYRESTETYSYGINLGFRKLNFFIKTNNFGVHHRGNDYLNLSFKDRTDAIKHMFAFCEATVLLEGEELNKQ